MTILKGTSHYLVVVVLQSTMVEGQGNIFGQQGKIVGWWIVGIDNEYILMDEVIGDGFTLVETV